MIHQIRILKLATTAALIGCIGIGASFADEKPGAQGSVILTVAGKVTNWNRGPMVPGRDNLFNQNNIRFEKAMAFDVTMLAGLPAQELQLSGEGKGGNGGEGLLIGSTFSGPTLADVLKASGAEGAKVRLTSLDGSTVDLSAEEIKQYNWMLALSVDGKPVGIGDFGPLWLLHKPASGSTPTKEDLQHWVWSVFYIEVL
jgi:hypothetical protein